jgi:hypothetical protein
MTQEQPAALEYADEFRLGGRSKSNHNVMHFVLPRQPGSKKTIATHEKRGSLGACIR